MSRRSPVAAELCAPSNPLGSTAARIAALSSLIENTRCVCDRCYTLVLAARARIAELKARSA